LFIYSLLHNFLQVRAKPCNLGKIVLKIRRPEMVVGVQVPLPVPSSFVNATHSKAPHKPTDLLG